LIGEDWITSTLTTPPLYDIPLVFDMPLVHDHSKKQAEKVSIFQSFLRSCLELMKYESSLSSLCRMIDHCAQEKEKPIAHRVVKHVHNKKITNRKFHLNE
jgi:hypothetical protein